MRKVTGLGLLNLFDLLVFKTKDSRKFVVPVLAFLDLANGLVQACSIMPLTVKKPIT